MKSWRTKRHGIGCWWANCSRYLSTGPLRDKLLLTGSWPGRLVDLSYSSCLPQGVFVSLEIAGHDRAISRIHRTSRIWIQIVKPYVLSGDWDLDMSETNRLIDFTTNTTVCKHSLWIHAGRNTPTLTQVPPWELYWTAKETLYEYKISTCPFTYRMRWKPFKSHSIPL